MPFYTIQERFRGVAVLLSSEGAAKPFEARDRINLASNGVPHLSTVVIVPRVVHEHSVTALRRFGTGHQFVGLAPRLLPSARDH